MSETETLLSSKKGSPPRSPGGGSTSRRKQYGGTTKGNELMGESLLLQNYDVGVENNYASNNRNTPQSVEPQNGISPLSTNGLPPIPLRRRADSGSSVGSSPGYDISPKYPSSTTGTAKPPKHRRSNSPKQQHPSQRRRSRSPSPNSTPGSNYSDNNIIMNNNNFNMNMQQINNAHHPLYSNSNNHQRRSSDTYNPILEHYNHHRRTHSYDATPLHQQTNNLRRGNSSLSLYSLHSQSSTRSMNSETMKLLPDPRWGGGSGGSRTRSYSGGSYNMGTSALNVMNSYSTPSSSTTHHNSNDANGMLKRSNSNPLGSYSTDSEENKILYSNNNGTTPSGYGSMASTSTGKEVISTSGGTSEMMQQQQQPLRRQHRRTNSDVSVSTYASAVSIDRSVDPVMTDMSKSAMFKGVTNDGVVKLQLPKDNFRLLSDRDLESGTVYKRALVDNEDDYFQDYHITVEDNGVDSVFPPISSECQCTCANCENCHVRRKQLPPTYYVMAVDSDIYRRMFDEVSESLNMPCGLFYCGHHEDVDYPNIGIAVAGVAFVFLLMIWATIFVDG